MQALRISPPSTSPAASGHPSTSVTIGITIGVFYPNCRLNLISNMEMPCTKMPLQQHRPLSLPRVLSKSKITDKIPPGWDTHPPSFMAERELPSERSWQINHAGNRTNYRLEWNLYPSLRRHRHNVIILEEGQALPSIDWLFTPRILRTVTFLGTDGTGAS